LLNFCIVHIKLNFSDWILLCLGVLYFIYMAGPQVTEVMCSWKCVHIVKFRIFPRLPRYKWKCVLTEILGFTITVKDFCTPQDINVFWKKIWLLLSAIPLFDQCLCRCNHNFLTKNQFVRIWFCLNLLLLCIGCVEN
jgi:hypothetical protein